MTDTATRPSREDDDWVPGWSPELGTRIASVVAAVGGPGKASALVGVKPEQISKWRDGKARAPFLALAALAKVAGVSLDWIANGDPSRDRNEVTRPSQKPEVSRPRMDLAQIAREIGVHTIPRVQPAISDAGVATFAFVDGTAFVRLPFYSMRVRSTENTASRFEDTQSDLLFSVEWVRSVLQRYPEQLICTQARGDAMAPQIREGDYLIIDRGISQIRDHGIYCFDHNGHLAVRRILYRISGAPIRVISDNPVYPMEECEVSELERFLIGLVIWHGRMPA